MKPLSQQCRQDVIALLQHGDSTRQIASQLHISHPTVSRIRQEILPDKEKSLGGHPHALTEQDKCSLLCSISSGRCSTAIDAQKNLREHHNINISAQTVRNTLKKIE